MNQPDKVPCPCGSGKSYFRCHGKGRPIPSLENVASLEIDREKKRVIFVTKDILVNQVHRDGPQIAKSFDALTANDLKEVSEVLGDAFSLVYRHVKFDEHDYKSTCAGLLLNAMSTFMAGVEVARHGYRRPFGAIARGIVEALSTILHIAVEPRALTDFHQGKLNSSKSVSVAKRVFPPFGHYYGMLSNEFVHINQAHATFEPINLYKEDDAALPLIVSIMRTNIWLIYVIAELVFYDQIPSPRYWRDLGGGHFVYDPSAQERAWQKGFLDDDRGE